MTDHLFSPITLGDLDIPNRIAIAPMCQYSADDGSATDWHLQQWMTYALSGAGMVTMEMTDVERRGRITHGCLGLYSDHNEAAAKRALDAARRVALPGTEVRRAACPCRPQGVVPAAMGGRRPAAAGPGSVADRLGFGPALRRWLADAACADRGRDPGADRPLRQRGASRRAGRLRLHRTACAHMATCCTSSSRRCPTSAPTAGAARWRTACGWPSRSRRP